MWPACRVAQHLAIRVLTNMTPSGTIHSVYDRDGNLLMESNGLATGMMREYVWIPRTQITPLMGARIRVARPIVVVDAVNTASPTTWWVSTDHLNRPVRMTDAAKATVWQATWKPFGEPQSITGSATLDARFPGQWFQLESGLHQNWWRHYDPTTGRYTQVDPLGLVDGPSVYGYALSNPKSNSDLTGKEVFVCRVPLGGVQIGIIHHEYNCVTVGGYSYYTSNYPTGSVFGSPGTPGNDKFSSKACSAVGSPDSCFENCLLNKGGSPRPNYDVTNFSGSKCQKFTQQQFSECRQQCVP